MCVVFNRLDAAHASDARRDAAAAATAAATAAAATAAAATAAATAAANTTNPPPTTLHFCGFEPEEGGRVANTQPLYSRIMSSSISLARNGIVINGKTLDFDSCENTGEALCAKVRCAGGEGGGVRM